MSDETIYLSGLNSAKNTRNVTEFNNICYFGQASVADLYTQSADITGNGSVAVLCYCLVRNACGSNIQ